jgi:hypothetical protein
MADSALVGRASLRLVLVHLLAQLPDDVLKEGAEGANTDLKSLEELGNDTENYLVPYRQEVDNILARAVEIARQRKSSAPE